MIHALIFDFDGLLADSEAPSLVSWQELYAAHGHELPLERWRLLVGTWESPWDPRVELEQRCGAELPWHELEPARRAREHELAAGCGLMPGVAAFLDEAGEAGLPLAVASSSAHAWVDGHLTRLGIRERFTCVLTRDDVARTKPDPELFVRAAACLGVAPSEALAFEDSRNGLVAAAAADIPCVVVPNELTAGMAFPEALVVLPRIDAEPLAALISRAEARG
jgi:HAD superfamily hydrolase (TIGR01509 family)